MSDPVEDLVATVADLKQRVEALERELATKAGIGNDPNAPVEQRHQHRPTNTVDLAALWDNASNQEKRWSEDDFVESR